MSSPTPVEPDVPVTAAAADSVSRRLPVGAEIQAGGGVHFRVWAPDRRDVAVVIDGRVTALTREPDGYFSGLIADAGDGTRYQFKLDDDDYLRPDVASRYQPDGPHGPSEVIDPTRFQWTDADWPGCTLERAVLYELHIGTFTPEGTWRAAAERLPLLRDLGVTVIEVMPIAEFPGAFGWGYDGVDWFAPTRLYGNPEDCRAFVDRAHALGVGVILDVVYNHFGPDGNYVRDFARAYFSERYHNEWGDPLNFDGPDAHGVRELVLANVQYWIEEFHVDGYRLDATQQIFDASDDHILAALTRRAHETAGRRRALLFAENESQQARLMRPPDRGGYGLDALWNDDFHHSAVVALTGRREAYYRDYRGFARELLACAKWGFLYQGQHYPWQTQARGTPALDCAPAQFVTFIENHDQVANSAFGQRLHQRTSPGRFRAMTALMLLLPGTPLLFQGQEFSSSKPFLFFADHQGQLREDVRKGRAKFLSQFPSIAEPSMQERLADPGDPDVFKRCVLDWEEQTANAHVWRLHRDLLALRRETAAFRGTFDGVVFGDHALVLRFFGQGDDRLVVINLGADLPIDAPSDPLLAPPEDADWRIVWSSEAPEYGAGGAPPFDPGDWRLTGESVMVLAPQARTHNE